MRPAGVPDRHSFRISPMSSFDSEVKDGGAFSLIAAGGASTTQRASTPRSNALGSAHVSHQDASLAKQRRLAEGRSRQSHAGHARVTERPHSRTSSEVVDRLADGLTVLGVAHPLGCETLERERGVHRLQRLVLGLQRLRGNQSAHVTPPCFDRRLRGGSTDASLSQNLIHRRLRLLLF